MPQLVAPPARWLICGPAFYDSHLPILKGSALQDFPLTSDLWPTKSNLSTGEQRTRSNNLLQSSNAAYLN